MARLSVNGSTLPEVFRLLLLIIALVVLAVASLMFVPVDLRAELHQDGIEANLKLEMTAPLVKMRGEIQVTDKIRLALDHIWRRWREKGEPVKAPLQETVRRIPYRVIYAGIQRTLRYLRKKVELRRFEVRGLIGGADAMESALLAGASWAIVGKAIGGLSHFARVDPKVPSITIVPDFNQQCFRFRADCILRVRLGNAMVAGFLLLRRILKERELIAWMRDSWRRKGVEGNERPSDSRSHENSDGDDQGHG